MKLSYVLLKPDILRPCSEVVAQRVVALAGNTVRFIAISIFVLIIVSMFTLESLAQVTIKETVILSPPGFVTPQSKILSNDFYVASDSGTYWGRIGLARKYSPIAFGSLSVSYRDTTFVFDTRQYVLTDWSWQEVQFSCADPATPIYYTAYYAYDPYTPLRFFLPDVHVGDTLRFMYAGISGTQDCGGIGGVGMIEDICMYTPDECYTYYEGELQELVYCGVELGVLSADLAGYRVVAEDDTIGAGKSTPVRSIAIDSVDEEVPVDSTTLLTYRLLPDTVGMFINALGVTLPSPLTNVPYADARAGLIRFLAADSLRDSVQAIIEVVQLSDTTKRGRDTVWIAERVRVVFTRPDSTNVYPTFKHNNLTTKRNWIDLELKVLSSDSLPVPNYWVKVLKPTLVDSGGHSHGGNRPMGRFNHPLTSTDTLHTTDTLMVRTDSTGKGRFRYIASQFGGVEGIRAYAASDTTKFDTLSLITRVPGLDSLKSRSTNLITHTSTEQFHRLQNSNYGTATTRSAVYSAVRQYANDFEVPEDAFLAVIDMSLPLGGLFDIGGNWNVPHSWHRTGKSVDFSKWYLNANRDTITIIVYSDGVPADTTSRIEQTWLDRIFKNVKPNGFTRYEAPSKIHYQEGRTKE